MSTPAPITDRQRNWVALGTIVRREINRILRIWGQTLVPPAITMTLYFLIFGGLIGTSSGVAGGLAATDPKLVPYGCLTAAFYTALGCLLGPSLLFFVMRGLLG